MMSPTSFLKSFLLAALAGLALAGRPALAQSSALEADAIGEQVREVEADALEEVAGCGVGVLVGVEDVGAVPVEDLGERRHDAAPVGAGDEQCGGLTHGGRTHGVGLMGSDSWGRS